MRRRLCLIAVLLLCAPLLARADESELAITDASTLRGLDTSRLGLAQMFDQSAPLTSEALFALPAMAEVLSSLHAAAATYVADGPDVRLFDQAQLTSPDTRFVLAGIVNRMDRAYVAPDSCGEIRLIYRLTRTTPGETPPRLPMTLNLVLHARLPDDAVSCAELARRWLDGDREAALQTLTPAHIDRIETNLQISHRPQSDTAEFRTEYLQAVFRRDEAAQKFVPAPMENQIDRERLRNDPALRRAFRDWLLAPEHLRDFDRGTVLIPEQFLATSSLAATPVGLETLKSALVSDDDVVAALRRTVLDNIRSPAGFARRLNDVTCGGCHQTRGIGGFHLPGADTLAAHPAPGMVPGSPHFAGYQLRRRAIVMSMRDGKAPDFSRGFADRPQTRGSTALNGTALLDGWGATCYRGAAGEPADASFASWRCAEGLVCQPAGSDATARIGMCFVK